MAVDGPQTHDVDPDPAIRGHLRGFQRVDPDRAAAKRAFEAMMDMTKIDIAAIEAARRG
jgi:hypothetical protein